MNPLLPRAGRPSRAHLALLIGLLACLLGGSLAWAQPAAPQPPMAAQPTQAGAALYLPMLRAPGAPAPVGAPTIERFAISSAGGPMAAEVALRWLVRDATSLSIEPRLGDVRGGASIFDYPLATTTYTLTVSNAQGSVSANVRYTVNALPTPNPLTVVATADPARAASARIGAAGGTLEATGADGTRYTLSVPPEALLYSEVITLTPVAAIAGMPFTASALHAVSIAPEGLAFIDPATLTITPLAAPTAPRTVGFAFQGAGSEFHLRSRLGTSGPGLAQAGGTSSLSVATARSYGTADIGDDSDLLAPLVRNPPSDPLDAAEHVQESRSLAERAPAGFVAYVLRVRPQLEAAVADPGQVDSAAQTYIAWRTQLKPQEDLFRDQISEANLLLGEALRKAGALASERCNEGRPAQGFALQRYMGYAKRFALVNTRAALEERLKKCWVFELTFDATLSATIPGSIDSDQVLSSFTMRFDSASGRIIGSGEAAWGQIIHTQPDSSGQQCVQSITTSPSTFDAATGERGLTLSPVSRTSPDINLALTYDPGRPSGMVTWACERGVVVTYDLALWRDRYQAFHLDELAGADFVATKSEPAASSILWEYQQSRPVGDGISVIEQTMLTIEHKPEP
jgi:hypothetical protein